MLDAVEALSVGTLLPRRPDRALDHAVLLRAMRGDELLLQPIAADQHGELVAGKNEPVAGTPKAYRVQNVSDIVEDEDS